MTAIHDGLYVAAVGLTLVVFAACSEPAFPGGPPCWADDGEWSGSVEGEPFTLTIEYLLEPASCYDGGYTVDVDWRWKGFGGSDQYSGGHIDHVDSVGTFRFRLSQAFETPYCSRGGELVGEFASSRRMEGFLTLELVEELEDGFCSETPLEFLDSVAVTLVRSP